MRDVALKDLDAVLSVNVKAPIIAIQAVIPHLGHGGRIINIGSWFGERVQWSGLAIYAMSKSALISLTRGLARELGAEGITVNLVQPGAINTDMNPDNGPIAETIRGLIPSGQFGTGRGHCTYSGVPGKRKGSVHYWHVVDRRRRNDCVEESTTFTALQLNESVDGWIGVRLKSLIPP